MQKILQGLSEELSEYSNITDAAVLKKAIDKQTFTSLSDCLSLAQGAERVLKMAKAGVYNDSELVERLKNTKDPLWHTEPNIKINDEQAYNMAMQFYKSNQQDKGETNILKADHVGKKVIEDIIRIFEENGKPFDQIEFDEPYFHAALLEATGEKGFEVLEQRRLQKWGLAKKLVNIRKNVPLEMRELYDEKANTLLGRYMKVGDPILRSGELFYTLTVIPTPDDAILDKKDYDEYVNEFFERADQPWDEIGEAQEILIEELNEAKNLRIRNEDGTDISMSIEGMTFANSLVLKNIPGSEVFSAPVRGTVKGRIVAKGRFKFDNSPVIENIWLDIDEKIIDCGADINGEALREIIYGNPGADEFGEIAFGTNPGIAEHLINGLLVEKIGGSFHMAVGGAYNYPTYNGKPINVDNGNRSKIHWDITTLLRGQNSEIIVDDKVLQKNGLWLDPRLTVLNEGRGAIEKEKQPIWRQKKHPAKHKGSQE